MRQLGDTLVWLAMVAVVVAVVHFTPRIANYVAAMSGESADALPTHEIAYIHDRSVFRTQ
jgi:hypothetical protein